MSPTLAKCDMWCDKVDPGISNFFWISPTATFLSPFLTKKRKILRRVSLPSSERQSAVSFVLMTLLLRSGNYCCKYLIWFSWKNQMVGMGVSTILRKNPRYTTVIRMVGTRLRPAKRDFAPAQRPSLSFFNYNIKTTRDALPLL